MVVVDEVAKIILGDDAITKVRIEGHTDKAGSRGWNRELSQRRAASVRARVIELGVAADKLTAQGFGFDRPIADDMTKEGRRRNRRVEFKLERYPEAGTTSTRLRSSTGPPKKRGATWANP